MTGQDRQTSNGPAEPVDSDLNGLPEIVARIVETMQQARLESVVLTKGDFHLELRSRIATTEQATTVASVTGPDGAGQTEDVPDEDIYVIKSPMIGTFYVAPAPGEPPFVQPGDTVIPDQVIGVVEAMKVMNEIAADRAGTVIDIVAENAETVEYGSPLVRLRVQP